METTLKEGAEIINKSLLNLGYDYQIDTTDSNTITEGLQKIGEYPPNQLNAIMEQMNLVLQFRNYGTMLDASKNKFRAFLIDLMDNGFGIEDVFHELMDALPALWDDKGQETDDAILRDLVSYDTAKIHRAFHIDGADARFKCTVDTRNYKKVFTPYGVTRYLDTKLANLSWSAEKWLMDTVINLITSMNAEGKIVYLEGHNINTKEGVNNVVEKIKATIAGFMTPSAEYNYGAYDPSRSTADNPVYTPVVNMTNSEDDIFIVTTPENFMRIKVQGYSNAFNLSQYELDGRIIFAPAGTDLGTTENGEKVLFYILDRRAIVLGIKHWKGGSFVVPNADRMNQWLLIELLKGYNTFFNAVAIVGEELGDFFIDEGATVVMARSGSGAPISYAVNDDDAYSQLSMEDDEYVTLTNVRSLRLIAPSGMSLTINGTKLPVTYSYGSSPAELIFSEGNVFIEIEAIS